MALITSGATRASVIKMALITSDHGTMRLPEHQNGPNHLGSCALQLAESIKSIIVHAANMD